MIKIRHELAQFLIEIRHYGLKPLPIEERLHKSCHGTSCRRRNTLVTSLPILCKTKGAAFQKTDTNALQPSVWFS